MNETENPAESNSNPSIGRNEPCPCGSGKKYKRCCGVSAAPKLTTPKGPGSMPVGMGAGGAPGAGIPGMDQFDPQMMMQMSQMLSRLPKGQMQKLQGIMQRAMAGKDVTREAQELEAQLPVEMQQMLRGLSGTMAAAGAAGASGVAGGQVMDVPAIAGVAGDAPGGMTEEEARRIVEEAAKKGEITTEQASEVLSASESAAKKSFWRKMTGKK